MGKSFEYFSVPLRHSPLSINMPTEIFPFFKKEETQCVRGMHRLPRGHVSPGQWTGRKIRST